MGKGAVSLSPSQVAANRNGQLFLEESIKSTPSTADLRDAWSVEISTAMLVSEGRK